MLGRLASLQLCASDELASAALGERLAEGEVKARRGTIRAREGQPLALDKDVVNVAVHPGDLVDARSAASVLSSSLGGDESAYLELCTRDEPFVYVHMGIDGEKAEELKGAVEAENDAREAAGLERMGGFEYEEAVKRDYPMRSTVDGSPIAGTVVGCMEDGGGGLTGLELQYDAELTGTDGWYRQERSRLGVPIVGGIDELVDAVDGLEVVLSLDTDVQIVAQRELERVIELWGAGDGVVVVTRPKTGEILACCSTPYLDPRDRAGSPAEAYVLKAASSAYEPGSTVKPLVAAMAIDMGLASPDTVYDLPAQIDIGGWQVGDVDGRDYATQMTLTQILGRSSNVGAVACAESVGREAFESYMGAFGFGRATGADFPGEAAGRIDWSSGAWQYFAFGQGFSATPLQMAAAIGAVANGGLLLRPTFASSIGGEPVARPDGVRVMSETAAAAVAQMMRGVVENGGASTGRIEGVDVSGKTGTAQRADEEHGGYLDGLYTTSFVGFAPTEDAEVLVYVLVDYVPDGSGSETVGEAWASVMRAALDKVGREDR